MTFIKYWVLLIGLGFVVCCNNQSKILIKEWKVNSVEFLNLPIDSSNLNSKNANLQQLTQSLLKNLFLTVKYNFKTENTCEISDENHTTTFNYQLLSSKNIIVFTDAKHNINKEVNFEKISKSELILITLNEQTNLKTKLFLIPSN